MKIALGMTGIGVSLTTTEIILRTFETVQKMGGEFSLKDAAKIEVEVEKKYRDLYPPMVRISELEKFYDAEMTLCGATEEKLTDKEKDDFIFLQRMRDFIESAKNGLI